RAMWLWPHSAGTNGQASGSTGEDGEDDEDAGKPAKTSGFLLEFDAARRIAQGLGAHLDKLARVVEVKGETARLLPVAERARFLFGSDGGGSASTRHRTAQAGLFSYDDPVPSAAAHGERGPPAAGGSPLD